jgi:transposase-like protein
MNLNRIAVRIMTGNKTPAQKQAALTALAKIVLEKVAGVCECPECGARKAHEDNGYPTTHYDYTLLCTDCGMQWCPNA